MAVSAYFLSWEQLHDILCSVCSVVRHCCFFCETTKENMKIKRSERRRCKLRTLASLKEDHNKFIQSGYNI